MKKGAIILIIIFSLIILFLLIRIISPKEIDDITPGIPCPELEKYNPDILYVIPDFNNTPISENQSWCNYILSLNKTLELHGIHHQPYREFLVENITQEQLDYGISEFEKCFSQTPDKFKPPQLEINSQNKELVKQNNLTLVGWVGQTFHKVYHCKDTGRIKNRWEKIL